MPVEAASASRPESIVIHTDGASRGNPGPAAIGVVIAEPTGRVLAEFGEALRPTTNNVAEYTAVIRALERARDLGARRVRCLMDSQLVVRQLNGSYRVKHADMLPLYRRVLELIPEFEEVTFAHVPREQNTEADRLANAALDTPSDSPTLLVERLFKALHDGRWEDAESVLGPGFQYRRAAAGALVGASAFLGAWERLAGASWAVQRVRALGPEVILEAARPHGALLWLCRIDGGQVTLLTEYRDLPDHPVT